MSHTYFNQPRQNAGAMFNSVAAPNFAVSSTTNDPFQNAVKATLLEDVFSATGPMTGLASLPTATVKVSRIANLVTLNVAGLSGATGSTSVSSLSLPKLPAKYRPPVDRVLPTLILNGTTRANGVLVVPANPATDLSVQTVDGTAFPSSIAGVQSTCVSWAVDTLVGPSV